MMVLVVVTMLPAAYMTIHIVQQSVFNNNVNRFVKAELQQLGTQIISSSIDKDSLKLRIVAVGREITEARQQEAQKRMEFYGLNNFELRVIQGAQSDSLMLLNNELTAINTSRKTERQQLINLTAQVNSLNSQLEEYTRYEALSKDIEKEMETLFPQINSLSLTRVIHSSKDTTAATHYVAAIIETVHAKPLPKEDVRKLHEWLQVRIKADSLIVVNSEQYR